MEDSAGKGWICVFCIILSYHACATLIACLLLTAPVAIAVSVMLVIGFRDDDLALMTGGFSLLGVYAILCLCLCLIDLCRSHK